MTIRVILAALLATVWILPANAAGDLVGRPERLPDLEVALGDAGYGVSQHVYELETGKGYRLWIKATGAKPCAFAAPEFFANIWFRKIEINNVEIKLSALRELEFEREGSAELFFTPTTTGEYEWVCKGLEDKGMTGKITVK